MSEKASKLLVGWSTSTHPFDRWFNKNLQECYEIEDASGVSNIQEILCEVEAKEN